jgi:glycosyltransferase involved in cell wall biosynthesis
MKSLSVVITMYNQAHSIEGAVESVLNQAVSVGEIIVVDGGSTDGSVEKVNAMQVQNIKLVEVEGCSIASMRNEGVKASSNHYVAFLRNAKASGQVPLLRCICNSLSAC